MCECLETTQEDESRGWCSVCGEPLAFTPGGRGDYIAEMRYDQELKKRP